MSEKPNGEAGSTIEILGDDGLTRRFKFRNGEEIHEFDQLIGGESNGLGATATETFGAVGQEFWCVVEDRLASCRRMFTLFGKPQFDDRPDNSSGNGDAEKLSQAFEEGFEALPILRKLFGQYYPRLNWNLRWDGLERLPLFSTRGLL